MAFTRPEAARFSFLLSIPANAAAGVLIIGDALESGETISGPDVIVTGVLTFFVALGTIAVLMQHGAAHELPALCDLPRGARRGVCWR